MKSGIPPDPKTKANPTPDLVLHHVVHHKFVQGVRYCAADWVLDVHVITFNADSDDIPSRVQPSAAEASWLEYAVPLDSVIPLHVVASSALFIHLSKAGLDSSIQHQVASILWEEGQGKGVLVRRGCL